MKFGRKILSGLILFASITTILPIGASAAWKQDSKGWWYEEGNSWATGWRQFNGAWYYFDSTGYMKTGWADINNDYYFFYTNGVMASNATINNFTLGADGKWIPTSMVEIKNKLAEQESINKFTSQEVKIVENKDNVKDKSNSVEDEKDDIDGITHVDRSYLKEIEDEE